MAGDGAEARAAGFPVALRPGNPVLAETDEIPPHQDFRSEGFAAEQEQAATRRQFQFDDIPPAAEVGQFFADEPFAADPRLAIEDQDAVLEARLQRDD